MVSNPESLVEVDVADLTGIPLDWAVAKAAGAYNLVLVHTHDTEVAWQFTVQDDEDAGRTDKVYLPNFTPSVDWALGGPLLEPEGIQLMGDPMCTRGKYQAIKQKTPFSTGYGPTYLIAAMRCYAMAKLGDKIKVPKELLNGNAIYK